MPFWPRGLKRDAVREKLLEEGLCACCSPQDPAIYYVPTYWASSLSRLGTSVCVDLNMAISLHNAIMQTESSHRPFNNILICAVTQT